jgi:hypothetical protein
MNMNATINNPEIGMAATINFWSDRKPATVVLISKSGFKITLRQDAAFRTDSHGMSDHQQYDYAPDPMGTIYVATLRKDGTYRIVGGKQSITLGVRRKYHDYSF